MFTINESIEELKKEIEEKKERIILLENWNSLEFTEENYHKLCETDFRGNKELGKKFEEIFPFINLIDKNNYPNEYIFCLKINGKNYKVLIPNSDEENIMIIIPRPLSYQSEMSELKEINKQLEKIEKGLNAKTIFNRANFLFENYTKPFQVFFYLTKYKNKKNYIARLTEIKKDLEKRYASCIYSIAYSKQQYKEYDETIKIFKEEFAPKFLEWTNEIIIKETENYYANSIRITK